MKKYSALLLAIILMSLQCVCFAESGFSTSIYEDAGFFSIDQVSSDREVIIFNNDGKRGITFTHPHQAGTAGLILNTMVVQKDPTHGTVPMLMTWITTTSNEPLYIDSISFELNGHSYSFASTNQGQPNNLGNNTYSETQLVWFGSNCVDFFADVSSNAIAHAMGMYNVNGLPTEDAPSMRMIFHGTEDIEAWVPEDFWLDYAMLVLPLYGNDLIGLIYKSGGSECVVTNMN